MSRSLIVMPDDSARPILDAINGATKSLRVKMFIFSDPSLLKAVIAAKRRGVTVRIMLNPARRSGESENKDSHKKLVAAGVEVLADEEEAGVGVLDGHEDRHRQLHREECAREPRECDD